MKITTKPPVLTPAYRKETALINKLLYGLLQYYGADPEVCAWADEFYSSGAYTTSSNEEMLYIVTNCAVEYSHAEMEVYADLYEMYATVKQLDTRFANAMVEAVVDIEAEILNPTDNTDIFGLHTKFYNAAIRVIGHEIIPAKSKQDRAKAFVDMRSNIDAKLQAGESVALVQNNVVPFNR